MKNFRITAQIKAKMKVSSKYTLTFEASSLTAAVYYLKDQLAYEFQVNRDDIKVYKVVTL